MKLYSVALSILMLITLMFSACGQPSTHSCTFSTGRAGITVVVSVNGQTRNGSQTTDANGNVTVSGVPSNVPCSNVGVQQTS